MNYPYNHYFNKYTTCNAHASRERLEEKLKKKEELMVEQRKNNLSKNVFDDFINEKIQLD